MAPSFASALAAFRAETPAPLTLTTLEGNVPIFVTLPAPLVSEEEIERALAQESAS